MNREVSAALGLPEPAERTLNKTSSVPSSVLPGMFGQGSGAGACHMCWPPWSLKTRPGLISWAPRAAAVPALSPVPASCLPSLLPPRCLGSQPLQGGIFPWCLRGVAGRAGCRFPGIEGKRVVIPRTWLWSSWSVCSRVAPGLGPVPCSSSSPSLCPATHPYVSFSISLSPCPSLSSFLLLVPLFLSLFLFASPSLSSADQITNI